MKPGEKPDEWRIVDNAVHDLTQWNLDTLGVELRGLEDIYDSFPEIDTDAMANEMGIPDAVTKEDVDKTKTKLDNQFSDKVNQANEALVKVKCHSCGETFSLQKGVL
jgi:hypothetical protein